MIETFEMLVSRRDGGKLSQILVVGHRIAEDDLSAHILARGDFEHVCLPLFAPKKMSFKIMAHETFRLCQKAKPCAPTPTRPTKSNPMRNITRALHFGFTFSRASVPGKMTSKSTSHIFHFLEVAQPADRCQRACPWC